MNLFQWYGWSCWRAGLWTDVDVVIAVGGEKPGEFRVALPEKWEPVVENVSQLRVV